MDDSLSLIYKYKEYVAQQFQNGFLSLTEALDKFNEFDEEWFTSQELRPPVYQILMMLRKPKTFGLGVHYIKAYFGVNEIQQFIM